MRRFARLATIAALALPHAAAAQDIVLVQHVTNVTLARAGGAILVTAKLPRFINSAPSPLITITSCVVLPSAKPTASGIAPPIVDGL
jgi:hypothetical protein